jgi:hypothetical protein
MSPQLYAQAAALTEVVMKAWENGQTYFCHRYPGELGRFRWIIDAKDKERITPYEKWWRGSLMGLLQSRYMREPFGRLKGGDYSAYHRHFPDLPTPDYLRPHLEKPVGKGCDLRVFTRELEFSVSEDHVGLQIADVLANALRRALSDRLGADGWGPISRLMIHRSDGAIVPINFGDLEGRVRAAYGSVVNQLNRRGRSMLVEKRRSRATSR